MTGYEIHRKLEAMYPKNADDPDPLSIEECRDLLSSPYRRYTLASLITYTTPISLARVSETVTEQLYSTSAEKVVEKRARVYGLLYHIHVPRLTETGVLRYDRSDDSIAFGPNAGQLISSLEKFDAKRDDSSPWREVP